MITDSSASADLLAWDTEFFHRRIARVRGDTLEEDQVSKIDEWSKSQRIECLYFLARADDPATIRTAGKHGFDLVDIRMTFERSMGNKEKPAQPESVAAGIRPMLSADLPELEALARTAHTDTRFFSDGHFPRTRAEEFYSTWIRLECEGRAQKVLVAVSPTGQPAGYISCHIDSARESGQIGLVAVGEGSRGKGLGTSLVVAACDWLTGQGAGKVSVVTQGRNPSAQRLYQRCGFLTQTLQLWFHKWYPTC